MKSNCVFPAAVANGAGPASKACPNPLKYAHRATIMPKTQFMRFRTHKDRFGTGIDVVWGIKRAKDKGPRGGRVYVHAINFDLKKYNSRQAKMWLKRHGYDAKKFEAATGKLVVKKVKKKAKKKAARKRAANAVHPSGVEFQYVATGAPRSVISSPVAANNPQLLVLNPKAKRKIPKGDIVGYITLGGPSVIGYEPLQRSRTKKKAKKKAKRKNPQLMVLTNPNGNGTKHDVKAAKKAFNRFHFKDPDKTFKKPVPNSWPKAFVVIGECEMFSVKPKSGKTVKRKFMGNGKMPLLCMDKAMKDVYIVGSKKLGVPAGNAVQVDYRVPVKSGRNKWARRWYHPHDTHPKVNVSNDGKYVRISGPGLRVSPRGIIG